jgi:hypothetical protein
MCFVLIVCLGFRVGLRNAATPAAAAAAAAVAHQVRFCRVPVSLGLLKLKAKVLTGFIKPETKLLWN